MIESSQNAVVGDTNSAVVAVETEKPDDAVEMMLFQKLQKYPIPQAFASLAHAVGAEESVQARIVASNFVTVDGAHVDAAAEDSERFGAQVDLEKSE